MDKIPKDRRKSEDSGQYKSLDVLDVVHSGTLCGCGQCKPTWIQTFANPKVFTLNAALIMVVKVSLFTYFGGVLATLERRFQLSSVESGYLSVINDIAELSIAVFVSYFGHSSHRPRWVAIGSILIGIGVLLSAMPHFVSNPLDPAAVISGSFGNAMYDSGNNLSICLNNLAQNLTNSVDVPADDDCIIQSQGLDHVKWLIVGQILIGLGTAPFYPLIISYLDDSVGKLQLTSYTAVLFVAMAIGAAGGYVISSQTTSLYVDFDRVPGDDIPDIPQYDPRWIGAWWLGFVFNGVCIIILSVPMFFFPRKMLRPQPVQEPCDSKLEPLNGHIEKVDELDAIDSKDERRPGGVFGQTGGILGVLRALKRLLTNVPLMFICLSASCETATFAIMGAFGIKTIQLQFTISPALAAGIFGGLLIPINILSQLVSAYICRKFKLGMRGCARMILLFLTIGGIIYPLLMFVGCDNFQLAGVNAEYPATAVSLSPGLEVHKKAVNLTSSCNSDCECSEELFRPVCGSDSITYVSPCHAGCTSSNTSVEAGQSQIRYTDCKCIVNQTLADIPIGSAVSGLCLDCGMVIFIISTCLWVPLLFAMYVTANPLIYIMMRIVDEEDRSVALAFKTVMTKCIGYFPSPVLFGAIINSTCIFWQHSCGNRGSCWIYDIVNYRYAYYGSISALRFCSILCYIVVNFLIKPEPNELEKEENVESKELEEMDELNTDCDDNGAKKSNEGEA